MELKPVDVTSKAQQEIIKIMERKNIPQGYKLRIGIEDKTISCGATSYTLGFDLLSEKDLCYTENTVEVIIKKTDALHLAGLTLDFITEDETSGFSFSRMS